MADKLLIDSHYSGETRIAIISDDGIVNNFETEYFDRKLIKGNIYLATVSRIEPSLQAAFIDYGDEKHGFLPFSEIQQEHHDKDAINSADKPIEKRAYKIQDVIHHNQVILVQAIREKRGNKCAAFSTFLSLPGKYCVLVSNCDGKSGGISKKIDSADKERLREIIASLELPAGLGVIIRTAGENRTKQEIKRDFEYLLRLWHEIKEKVALSKAPLLIHEEGNIIKRTIRDLYQRTMDKIIVQGQDAYREARTFMKIFTPSHCRKIELYNDQVPIFCKYGVEENLKRILDTMVALPSGGSIVINSTEALTAIDVNSGKNKHANSIDTTALKTNLEATAQIARQIKLRDIAGLIVIDFIDMQDQSFIMKVEKKFKDSMKDDYSNIQIGKISQFGLLEISRQRLRQSLSDANFIVCKHCNGAGKILSDETVAMSVIRQIDGYLVDSNAKSVIVEVASGVDLFILNKKRKHLIEIEKNHGVFIEIIPNPMLVSSGCKILIKEFNEAVHKELDEVTQDKEQKIDNQPIENSVESPVSDKKPVRKRRRKKVGPKVFVQEEVTTDTSKENEKKDLDVPQVSEEKSMIKKRKKYRKPRRHNPERQSSSETAIIAEDEKKDGWLKKIFG